MAEFTHVDLRAARESRKMPRWQLAAEIGVSEDTLERWETGKQKPDPDDVGRIEEALDMRESGLWHRWMFSNYDSYRKHHVDIPRVTELAGLVMRMENEMEDVSDLFKAVNRDVADGNFDDAALRDKFKKEVLEAMAAMQQTIDRL